SRARRRRSHTRRTDRAARRTVSDRRCISMTLRLPQIVVIVATIVGAIFLLMPVPAGMSPLMMRAAAVIVVALGIWSTGAMPSYFGSLLFLFAAMVLAVAPASVVFSGFHAGATWLVFGGLVIG